MTQLDMNGHTDLPAGKIATIVTHLEMNEPHAWRIEPRADVVLTAVPNPDPAWYLRLYREIGEEWLWFSRLTLSEGRLAEILGDARCKIFAARDQTVDIGLVELDCSDPENVEIAFFGLVPGAVGRGLGRWLMGEALGTAWSLPRTRRVWLHTCTLDHPSALAFYMKCGFQPHRRTIEVADDPRLSGLMPMSAGSRLPALKPGRAPSAK